MVILLRGEEDRAGHVVMAVMAEVVDEVMMAVERLNQKSVEM